MNRLLRCLAGICLISTACGREASTEVSGHIVALEPGQDTMTVATEAGANRLIRIEDRTKIMGEDGAPLQPSDLEVGSSITVEAAKDRSASGTLLAKNIWLQEAAPPSDEPGATPQPGQPSTPSAEPQPPASERDSSRPPAQPAPENPAPGSTPPGR
jgi:hypothetical protein